MSILSGYKRFKDYIKTDSGYILTSRRTTSDAVVMGDGTDDTDTLESRLGGITGISSDLTSTDKTKAASIAVVSQLNSNLNNIADVGGINVRYNSETDMVEIYYNGVWNEWKPGNLQSYFLIKDGDLLTDITGGFACATYSYGNPAISVDGDYFVLTANSTSSSQIPEGGSYSQETIDVTNYSKLKAEVYVVSSGSKDVRFGINMAASAQTACMLYSRITTANGFAVTNSTSLTEVEFDLSSLSGACYLNMVVAETGTGANTAYAYVKRVWLE